MTGAHANRTCPLCEQRRVCSVREAEAIFQTGEWRGSTAMLEAADVVCSFCHGVRIDGVWERMQTVDSRAYELSQVSSSKTADDYRALLTAGIDPGAATGDAASDRAAPDHEDLEW